MKRLVRKNSIPVREITVLPTTPIYNPMGEGDKDGEFAKTDAKSYSRMMNQHTMEEAEERTNDARPINEKGPKA